MIGALTLYAGEKDFFDRQQVELLRQMGADISFALDNIDREARRRKAEQALQDGDRPSGCRPWKSSATRNRCSCSRAARRPWGR